ncbi:ATP-binding protein, partial [Burkholderia sp. LMG 13014]
RALAFAKSYADGFDAALKTGRSALFIGKPGTGKTHLAVGVGLQIMERDSRSVLFMTVMRAVRRVKDTWGRNSTQSESEAIASLVFPDLLILDEVGVQFGSDAERLILFDVLNERYEKRRPTLLLSNFTRDEVQAFLGERIFDRLREDGGEFIPFDWESHRGGMA